jgi:hypothetical protein
MIHEVGRQGGGEIALLSLLLLIHADRRVRADPLAPPVQRQIASLLHSARGRVADEPEMRVEAALGERLGQADDPRRDAPCTRVLVGAFERKEVELHRGPSRIPPTGDSILRIRKSCASGSRPLRAL